MVYMSPRLVLRAFPTWLTSDNAVRVHNEVGSQVWKVASRPKAIPNEELNSALVHLFLFFFPRVETNDNELILVV
jgi:hypothetical protein